MIKRIKLRGIVERLFSGLIGAAALLCFSLFIGPQSAQAAACSVMDQSIKTLDAGSFHTVGLKGDGTVIGVGDRRADGQLNVSSWTNIKAIAAGGYHTVGLKEDGTVVAIGNNDYGQLNVSGWANIKTIAGGPWNTLGLKEDGTVVAAGYNGDGQLNVSGWTNIKAIAAGLHHAVGLKEDGTVVAMGNNDYGAMNVSSWTNIKAIAAGLDFTVGLKEDGTLVASGYNGDGQLNVSSWSNIKAIAAGGMHTVGLKEDGKVIAAGSFHYGQTFVLSWANITAIAAGVYHTAGLKEDGTVVAVGYNTYGACNVLSWTNIKQPVCLVPDAVPNIVINADSIAFGAVENGSSSVQSISISNTGTADLAINAISISGPDSSQFSQTNNCFSVVSNASCTMNVLFTPASPGAKTAAIAISSNDPVTPTAIISLTGSGVDTISPTTYSLISGVPGAAGWYHSDVQLALTAADNAGGAGVKEIHYSIDGSETVVAGGAASFSVGSEGTHGVSYFAGDNAGNSETPHILSVKVDKTLPTITASSSPVPNANGWNNTDVAVTVACNDTISGIAACSSPFTATTEGAGQMVTGTAADQAGHTATTAVTLNIDKTRPTITAFVTPAPNANGCNNTDIAVVFACNDSLSGIASCPAPIVVTTEGAGQVISGTATDKAGNAATVAVTVNIDKTTPEAVIRFDATSQDIKVFNSETGAEAGYIVLPSVAGGDGDEDDEDKDADGWHHEKNESHGKELRQYTIQDCANNTLTLILRHKQEGNEAQIKVVSMQYNGGVVVAAAKNKMQAETSTEKGGVLKELEQKIEVKQQLDVSAKYSGKKDATSLSVEITGQRDRKETRAGMTLLELLTVSGELSYRY